MWSDGSGLRHSSLEGRRWISASLLSLLPHLSEDQTKQLEDPVKDALLQGIAAHLSVSSAELRVRILSLAHLIPKTIHSKVHGMFVGQSLAAKFCRDAESPLSFDLDPNHPEIQFITPLDAKSEDEMLREEKKPNEDTEVDDIRNVSETSKSQLDSDDDDFEPYHLSSEETKTAGATKDATERMKPLELFYISQCLQVWLHNLRTLIPCR